MDINELKARYAELIGKARALHDKAGEEKRDMSDDENTAFDAFMDEASAIETTIEREEKIARAAQRYVGTLPTGTVKPDVADADLADKDQGFRSFGEFLGAVQRASAPGGVTDQRLIETRAITGMSELVPADGGFLVQTDFVTELLKKTHEEAQLAGKTRKVPLSANSNGMTINAINETSRVDGSRWGGVKAYWKCEGEEKAITHPTFRQMELKLRKLIGLCPVTDELLEDTVALESIISQSFASEFAFRIDDAIVRGTGAGQPLGILVGGGLITVPAQPGQLPNTIVYENIVNMYARMWAPSMLRAEWYINQDTLPQLFNMGIVVGTGGTPAFMPAGGLSGSPYNTLFGRPVHPIEFCPTLGTTGDIIFADLSEYLMIEKGGMQAATSIHVRFVYDESVFRFVMRLDGQPIWNVPLTPYQGTNTVSPYVVLATRP